MQCFSSIRICNGLMARHHGLHHLAISNDWQSIICDCNVRTGSFQEDGGRPTSTVRLGPSWTAVRLPSCCETSILVGPCAGDVAAPTVTLKPCTLLSSFWLLRILCAQHGAYLEKMAHLQCTAQKLTFKGRSLYSKQDHTVLYRSRIIARAMVCKHSPTQASWYSSHAMCQDHSHTVLPGQLKGTRYVGVLWPGMYACLG